ncbi:MAG: hypothetical protein KatS3mg102_3015 [Planctomycetota bacterium]|nr:MAG: hypothetical protein KatS3mg102_3015 [Planctomycetota bacterium]
MHGSHSQRLAPQAGGHAAPAVLAALGAALLGALAGFFAARLAIRPAAPRPDTPASGHHAGAHPGPAVAPVPTSSSLPGAAAAASAALAAGRPAQSGSLVALGEGYVLYADGAGHLLLLRFSPRGSPWLDRPETLELLAAYAVREEPGRHPLAPERRSLHGFYLDDLALERAEALERAQAAFARELAAGAVDAGARARLERHARAVLAAGDASFLCAHLSGVPYTVRRTAALVLGEHGFLAAAPVLMEVAEQGTAGDAERARALLGALAGRPLADRAAFEAWWARLGPEQRARGRVPFSLPPGARPEERQQGDRAPGAAANTRGAAPAAPPAGDAQGGPGR